MLQALHQFEGSILLFFQNYIRSDILTAFLVPLTHSDAHGELWIVFSLLLISHPKTRKAGWMGLFSLLFCYLLNDGVIKNLVQRPRPWMDFSALSRLVSDPTSFSFPSGHTNSSFAAANAYRLSLTKDEPASRWIVGISFALAVFMGISRMYVGVHYPTDVLGGMLVGLLGSALVCRLLSPMYERRLTKQLKKEL